MISRRGLLLGAGAGASCVVGAGVAGVIGVDRGVLPGRIRLDDALHRGVVSGPLPPGPAAPLQPHSFASAHRRRAVSWIVASPDGVALRGLPVVLVLHGRGGTASAAWDQLRLHAFLAAHVRGGGAPMALVSVDGGRDTYWHPRTADDPLGMVVDELLPRIGDLGLDTARLGALGWSMGGYGALLMARESAAGRFGGHRLLAAAAGSPALFASARATSPGSFDGPADSARWGDLVRRPGVDGSTLQVSCGRDDAFRGMTERYVSRVSPKPAGYLHAGRHDVGYWRWLAPRQLRFLGERLA